MTPTVIAPHIQLLGLARREVLLLGEQQSPFSSHFLLSQSLSSSISSAEPHSEVYGCVMPSDFNRSLTAVITHNGLKIQAVFHPKQTIHKKPVMVQTMTKSQLRFRHSH